MERAQREREKANESPISFFLKKSSYAKFAKYLKKRVFQASSSPCVINIKKQYYAKYAKYLKK